MLLLLGGTGYVGSAFQKELLARSIPFEAPQRSVLDYSIPAHLNTLLDRSRWSLVVNAVGFTGIPNVEAAERDKSRCYSANVDFPLMLVRACAERGLALGHVSTGCIYSGRAPDGNGWKETSPPNFDFRHNNCSFYSGCKALAEEVILDYPQVWVWRLRRPFNGENKTRNYLAKVIGYPMHLQTENSISQIDEFAAGCLHLAMEHRPFGIYNMTNPGSVLTSEITTLLEKYGLLPAPARFFSNHEEYIAAAGPTPRSECVLDSSKAQAEGVRFTEVHEALEQAISAWAG